MQRTHGERHDLLGDAGAIIAWGSQDPELLAEHFLTVALYNLQHPAQFTEAALVGLRAVFIERLDHGLAVAVLSSRVSFFRSASEKTGCPWAYRYKWSTL